MPTPIILPYSSTLVVSRQALEIIFCTAISKLCIYAHFSFLLEVLVGGPFRFSVDFKNIEDIVAKGVHLPLPEGGHNFEESVGISLYCLTAVSTL